MTGPRGLAVFDLDGTISRHDTFMPFVSRWLLRHPHRWPGTVRMLPTLLACAAGRADRGALKGQWLHVTLGGLPRRTIEEWALSHVTRLLRGGVFPSALERIRWHRDAGHYLVLMSASVDCYVPEIGRRLGFDETICSPVRWNDDGTLDGRLAAPNCRDEEKVRQLQRLQQRMQFGESWAYGNSRADLPHLRRVTHGVYVNGPTQALPADAPNIRRVRWQ